MVWRRLVARSDSTIAGLHHVLQIAFGWSDEHLHCFRIHGKEYGIPHVGGIDEPLKLSFKKRWLGIRLAL